MVYPRPRGGTGGESIFSIFSIGLSPPTRGNLDGARRLVCVSRSIPAHAGEPTGAVWSGRRSPVYPRPRGGTDPDDALSFDGAGLSPPTRGNRHRAVAALGVDRSIPAHAGEPRGRTLRLGRTRVYPRPRGGTSPRPNAPTSAGGLSPPTRGNQTASGSRPFARRSIPAHAGEPAASSSSMRARRVYPRPRGGTRVRALSHSPPRGLSPPTRGNRALHRPPDVPRRSIPAHAGEPVRPPSPSATARVYPRPRGGTREIARIIRARDGLSPPTRGNPDGFAVSALLDRSIPAHAGEPTPA